MVTKGCDISSPVISDRQLSPGKDYTIPRELPSSLFESYQISGPTTPVPRNRDSKLGPTSPPHSLISSPVKIAQYQRKNILHNVEVSPPTSPEVEALQKRQSGFYLCDEEVSPIEEKLAAVSTHLKGSSQKMKSISVSPGKKKFTRDASSVTEAVNTESKREREGDGHTRQAIDPKWDPYSGEITSSDRGKPQSVKPRLYGASLRPGNDRTDQKNNTVVPTSLSERIRKLTTQNTTDIKEKMNETQTARKPLPDNTKSGDPPSRFLVKRPSKAGSLTPTPSPLPSPSPALAQAPAPESTQSQSAVPKSQAPHTLGSSSVSIAVDEYKESKSSPDFSRPEPTESTISGLDQRSHMSSPTPSQNQRTTDFQQKIPSTSLTGLEKGNKMPADMNRNSLLPGESRIPSITDHQLHKLPQGSHPLDPEKNDGLANLLKSDSVFPMFPQSSIKIDEDQINSSKPIEEAKPQNNNLHSLRGITPSSDHIIGKSTSPDTHIFVSSALNGSEQTSTTKIQAQIINKELPSDRIIFLQAKLDDLAYRRRKIAGSIARLKDIVPISTLFISEELVLRQRAEKKQMEILVAEEADVRREEHEVSLQLHRAWKRKDRNANFEPTSLWVRRLAT